MCRKRFLPFSAFAIIENMVHGSFHQFRVIVQKQRSSRISQVDCSDRTITEVFFRKEYQVTVRSFYQFMSSQCLTISQCTKFGIFTSTGSSSFFHQFLVESSAVLHLCLVFFLCFLELGNNRFITLTIPVRTQVITKVLDRINIIISDQQVAISFLCFAQ